MTDGAAVMYITNIKTLTFHYFDIVKGPEVCTNSRSNDSEKFTLGGGHSLIESNMGKWLADQKLEEVIVNNIQHNFVLSADSHQAIL